MSLSTDERIAAITHHSAGFAEAARGNLDARVEHCPDWSVADLVRHLTEVHWFWRTIVEERLESPPDESRRPPHASDDELVDTFVLGAGRIAQVLANADQSAHCWTWAGWQQDVAFVTRHQVQEAAVHHWDAVNAVGRASEWSMRADDAIDAVEEFLTESVANRRWPQPDAEPLGGTIWFCPCDSESSLCPTWHVTDGDAKGTVAVSVGAKDEPEGHVFGSHGDPAALLLWLYRRVPDGAVFTDQDPSPEDAALLDRFRALSSTS
jgi:uncharacterized protein (TIGR03083 family)